VTRRDLFTLALGSIPLRAQTAERAVYLTLDDALPVLKGFSGELPTGLDSSPSPAGWLKWEKARDLEIRARLKPGDADSIVNLLLFGTSFTSEARLNEVSNATRAETGKDDTEAAGRLILARVRDFTKAVMHPAANERMQFAASWLKENGVDLADPVADKRIGVLLLENTRRVLREQRLHNSAVDAAKKSGDAGSLFVARSSLYRDRGLSLDTSFRPNYAIERTLGEIKSAGRLGKIRRAAVIGPGLDFMDKRSGYDFYPIQTLQPFALVDSLRRLRMTETVLPPVDIFDLSTRVLNHVRRARQGSAYTVQVPLDRETRWLPETVEYWQRFGSDIGTSVHALAPPAGVDVRMRAVRIGPEVVKLLRPADLNVVLEHLPVPEDRKLDLMIATNVMVYYEPFEQALALQNIAGMLRKGGMLLTNNALPEVKGVPIRPAGGSSIAYSEDPDDGDHVVWYERV